MVSITQSYESIQYKLGCAKEHLSLWDWVIDFFQSALFYIIMKAKEIFVDIKGYEGSYQISNLGRIKSLDRLRSFGGGFCKHKGGFVATTLNGKGKHAYLIVRLWKNNIGTKFFVHRLIGEHFLPGDKKQTINHKDGNKLNNAIDNLEWATYSENNQHAHDTGLMNPCHGIDHPEAKLNDNKVRQIRQMLSQKIPQRRIAAMMGVSRGPIQRIADGAGWKHVK